MKIFEIFEKISEIYAWLKIVFSFTMTGLIIGTIIYYLNQTIPILILGICISLFGFIFGLTFATKMWKGKGTMWFLSRVMASPELDNHDENENYR
ncbi:hypothetical protein [Flavobacterium sp. GT3R68]|uniref:hypothetical protein n=1 Tax=Flavobacterium sp. GT3R68 TaxID=2594437 RepID=UPI000F8989CC|nr:hypothetical protein [Flavobacterium sp. GT3R68]RTY85908.1 hypothetical protein EKL32_28225 [Flavobacterium sp. GSN2]TRW89342.1 hypothetical protein FNW07_13505 [Flavobacterium sp. GT3R68]